MDDGEEIKTLEELLIRQEKPAWNIALARTGLDQ